MRDPLYYVECVGKRSAEEIPTWTVAVAVAKRPCGLTRRHSFIGKIAAADGFLAVRIRARLLSIRR